MVVVMLALVAPVLVTTAHSTHPLGRLPLLSPHALSIQDNTLILSPAWKAAHDQRIALVTGTANTSSTVPLGGGILAAGTFFVTTQLGETTSRLIFDTGSSDTLATGISLSTDGAYVPCSMDIQCQVQCDTQRGACMFGDTYGDGTEWVGYVVQDEVVLGKGLAGNAAFGMIVEGYEPHPLPMGISGIQGMAYPALSSFGLPSPFLTLAELGDVAQVFSHCLSNIPTLIPSSVTYGVGNFSTDDFEWVPVASEEWYVVRPTGLNVEGSTVIDAAHADAAFNQSIWDSGTTLWLLNQPAFDDLVAWMSTHYPALPGVACSIGEPCLWLGQGVTLTIDQLEKFPEITIVVPNVDTEGSDVTISVLPTSYLLAPDPSHPDVYFLGIVPSSMTIFGMVVLSGNNVVYDMKEGKVGFGSLYSTCPTDVGPVPPLPSTPSPPSSPAFFSTAHLVWFVIAGTLLFVVVFAAVLFVISRSVRGTRASYNQINT